MNMMKQNNDEHSNAIRGSGKPVQAGLLLLFVKKVLSHPWSQHP